MSDLAFLAAIQRTTIDDEGESKIALVAPSTELAQVMRLSLLGKRVLRITVDEEGE